MVVSLTLQGLMASFCCCVVVALLSRCCWRNYAPLVQELRDPGQKQFPTLGPHLTKFLAPKSVSVTSPGSLFIYLGCISLKVLKY